jgi:poly(3-hydroxybutyrate) depolymerase
MRKLLLLLLLPALVYAEPGKVTKQSIDSGGQRRAYYLFVPKNVSDSAPLIILLHGSGRDGASLLNPWKDLAAKEGIILAAPNALSPAGWQSPADGPALLVEIAEELKKAYPVDSRRVYLFGHSAGAVFALGMSCLESDYFAAAAIHAGAFRQPSEAMVMDSSRRKIPIYIQVGTSDPFFPLVAVRATRDAFAARQFPIELKEIPGHDHNYYVRASAINRSAWDFLKDNRLPEKSIEH